MTPGSYIRQCREAAGLTLDDVALRTETDPAVCARRRAEFLGSIEADLISITVPDAVRLHTIFPLDLATLIELSAAQLDLEEATTGLRAALSRSADLRMVLTRADNAPSGLADPAGRTAA